MAAIDDIIDLNRTGYRSDAFGQILGAVSHYQFGQQARAGAEYEAAQMRQNAGQALAASQHAALDVDRQSQLVASRALAVAAASGGGASDPGVVSLMAKYAQEGAYKKAVALYGGEEKALAMNAQADAKQYEGKNVALNSDMVAGAGLYGATTTLMKGGAKDSSLYQRFGMGAPTNGYPS